MIFSHNSRFSIHPKSNNQTKSNIAENIDYFVVSNYIILFSFFLSILFRVYLIPGCEYYKSTGSLWYMATKLIKIGSRSSSICFTSTASYERKFGESNWMKLIVRHIASGVVCM